MHRGFVSVVEYTAVNSDACTYGTKLKTIKPKAWDERW